MNEQARERFAAELERLKRNYLARLRGNHDELEGLHAACRGGDEGARARVHALAHAMAGTAGSYGLIDISQVATRVDLLCKDGADSAETAAALELLIAAIAAELA